MLAEVSMKNSGNFKLLTFLVKLFAHHVFANFQVLSMLTRRSIIHQIKHYSLADGPKSTCAQFAVMCLFYNQVNGVICKFYFDTFQFKKPGVLLYQGILWLK